MYNVGDLHLNHNTFETCGRGNPEMKENEHSAYRFYRNLRQLGGVGCADLHKKSKLTVM